ncbi:MAG: ATP-binding protein [Polyangiaceae bacterium]|nr:ATP-binding protein [Polyangiaceae bacterium]
MTALSAHYVTRTVQDLFSGARALVRVESAHRQRLSTGDELGGLAGSMNEIAQAFTDNVRTLAAERDRFRAVLESIGEAVVAVDAQSQITLCNRACLELLRSASPPVGRPLMEAIRHPALYDLAEKAIRTSSVPGEIELEIHGLRLLARAAPLSPEVGGVVLVMRDITALRRLENVRRDFVANVSHELRTPVSTIRTTAEALLDGALDDRQHAVRFLKALVRSAQRLSRIIADLLDLSRIEAGELIIETQPVSVSAAVHRALEVVDNVAQAKALQMVNEVDAETTAWADEKALDQVVLNLLDNAVKYTPEGGRIVVRVLAPQSGLTRLEVEDDGAGVLEKHRERIFERFYRVDPGRSRELGGTGLGLAIVRHLVEAMKGAVGVRPAYPSGAIFYVDLPSGPRPSREPPEPTSA